VVLAAFPALLASERLGLDHKRQIRDHQVVIRHLDVVDRVEWGHTVDSSPLDLSVQIPAGQMGLGHLARDRDLRVVHEVKQRFVDVHRRVRGHCDQWLQQPGHALKPFVVGADG
jgi:hypothetical protein